MFKSPKRHHFLALVQPTGWVSAAAWVTAFVLLTAVGARIDAPMHPVPMSMQSLAVLLSGAVLGWRLGGLAILAYLAAGAAGLPVFAGGAGGVSHFVGPTAGYLVAFPIAAVVAGLAAEQGWMRRFVPAMAVGLIGHLILLGLGAGWLAVVAGPQVGWTEGFAPFVLGAVAKSTGLAAMVLVLGRRAVT